MILQHVRHTLYLMNFFVVKLPPPSLHYINVECETVTYMYIDGMHTCQTVTIYAAHVNQWW